MEDSTKRPNKAHVLVVSYPAQGHINPMLQFSKRLASKGVKSTLATTLFISKSIPAQYGPLIHVRPISDGYDDGGFSQAESTQAYLDSLRANGSRTLARLIEALTREADPVDAVIYDGFLPWALDVAKQFGLLGVLFFTQSCAVNCIYYHVQRGLIQLPLSGPGPETVSVPGVPELQPSEAPSYVHKYGSYPFWFDVVLGQFSNIDQADWVLCNVFHDMEKQVVDWMSKLWRVRNIGPTVPSYYLDKRLDDDKDYNLQLFKPNTALCQDWLGTKPHGSVIYVSFGSMADLSEAQYEELALGLEGSNHHFLWVVRASEQPKLPKRLTDESYGLGLVVGWASQLEILAHDATGCFVSHCGFNSVLEAMCLGVPMVGMPQWTDQGTNAKFVEDVWGVGIRAKVDGEGIVRREEVVRCVREVMNGVKGEEIRENVNKWKKLAKEAIDEGGSSNKNIQEFVASLVQSSNSCEL